MLVFENIMLKKFDKKSFNKTFFPSSENNMKNLILKINALY